MARGGVVGDYTLQLTCCHLIGASGMLLESDSLGLKVKSEKCKKKDFLKKSVVSNLSSI